MYSEWLDLGFAARCGSSFEGYVCKGNLSKTRFINCGVFSHDGEDIAADVDFDCTGSACPELEVSSSCGIVQVHAVVSRQFQQFFGTSVSVILWIS